MSVITRDDIAPVEDGQDDQARAMRLMRRRSRIRFFEFIIWPAAVAAIFLLPSKMLILTEIAILALFAVSLVVSSLAPDCSAR